MIINFKEKQKQKGSNFSAPSSKNSESRAFTNKNADNIIRFSEIKKNESFEIAREKSRQSSLKIKW
ncbi:MULTISPECIES: hypothetical protein [unclassified Providencia]|uniref:hypothetical protein n=1 Tax=unclassified Providencia TaxID=2633465 RepID=UPI00234A0EBD|nr:MULTISPECIES: hypothetical protein [unclassified Providencia]